MMRFIEWRGQQWLCLAARVYLGAVFIGAAIHKIAEPGAFALDIATYGILPLALINPLAITLPWIEIAAGGFAVIGVKARASSLLMAGMMVLFIVALAIALTKGLEMGCGCFASTAAADENPISGMTILRDLAWLALALYPALLDLKPLGLLSLIPDQQKIDPS
jgi:putative oxidoreductase